MSRIRLTILILGAAIAMSIFFLFPKALLSKPEGKIRIAMAGRSVTEHWFKYWNWPWFFHDHGIYRDFPIPYKKYSKDDFYMQYIPVPAPYQNASPDDVFGTDMIRTIKSQVNGKDFDALLFKFCFVDFSDKKLQNEEEGKAAFGKMTSIAEEIYKYTQQEKMTLLLANALPTLHPGRQAQVVRNRYNSWVAEFAKEHVGVILIDLNGAITNVDGSLNQKYARDVEDSHINRSGYILMNKEFYRKLKEIKPAT